MEDDFKYSNFGAGGPRVFRLGLSASYWPGKETIRHAIDRGINFFFAFGFDLQMVRVLREVMLGNRERYMIATGAYNLLIGHPNLRRTLEKRLRQFKTDYIDVFLFLGVTIEKHLTDHVIAELQRFQEEGKVRFIGLSTHHRKLAGRLAAEGVFNSIMIRYNAAHRGAEEDIFPYLERHNPGLISYTATRWRYLIRRHKNWPANRPVPTAGQCYRFVLSNQHVDVCLTAPSNIEQLKENLGAVDDGPLSEMEMEFIKNYGDLVHHTKKWFM
jgi:aryl-alcohol dehydrogenase-like predicted oxidoreductase